LEGIKVKTETLEGTATESIVEYSKERRGGGVSAVSQVI
jgi:hypothetical protein